MFSKTINFILRFLLCTITIHSKPEVKVQSHKEFDIFACDRCGNLFAVRKAKYKK